MREYYKKEQFRMREKYLKSMRKLTRVRMKMKEARE
jgi:hypothetical protein